MEKVKMQRLAKAPKLLQKQHMTRKKLKMKDL